MFCAHCGTEIPGNSSFCRQCGTSLAGRAAATPVAASPAAAAQPASPSPSLLLLRPGMLFAGRYEILEELGRGGMGIVFKARDTRLNETTAIKVLLPLYSADTQILERFLGEVRTARRLSHPNIVKVYDLGEAEGAVYFTMEYLEGTDLEKLIAKQGRLPIQKTIDIIRHVALALEAAHRSRVIHRDVKPQNIFLTTEDAVKVLDFGIAKALDSSGVGLTGGGIVGTPTYMSPEQMTPTGQPDYRTDIYSLGAVLYQLCTGQVPFQGKNPFEVALKHVHDDPTPPRKVNPEIPPHIERVILRAMQKDPARRYPSISELLADLNRAGASSPQPGTPAPAAEPGALGSEETGSGRGEESWNLLSRGKMARGLTQTEIESGIRAGRYGPEDQARREDGKWLPLGACPELKDSLADAAAWRGARRSSLTSATGSASTLGRRALPLFLLVLAIGAYEVIRGYLARNAITLELESILATRFYEIETPTPKGLTYSIAHPQRHELDQDVIGIAKRHDIRCSPSDLQVSVDLHRKMIRLTLGYKIPMLFIPIHYEAEQEKMDGLSRERLRRFLEDPSTRFVGASLDEVRRLTQR